MQTRRAVVTGLSLATGLLASVANGRAAASPAASAVSHWLAKNEELTALLWSAPQKVVYYLI